MDGRATLTMVMSMMFMNMAATKTTLTLILGLMRMRGIARLPLRSVLRDKRPIPAGHSYRSVVVRIGVLGGDEAEPDLAAGVVAVGVDQDDALPGAEQDPSGQHRER